MLRVVLIAFILLPGMKVYGAGFNHDQWNSLLQDYVRVLDGGVATQVDYDGMLAQRIELQAYLQDLAKVKQKEFDSWPIDHQLAFLINAYNSWTVELILTMYPDLDSIKDLGSIFQSPWKKRFIPLLGKERTLDEIEHQLIRGSDRYNDPRIHFAVNCASIGCPALRGEAYTGSQLQQQLAEATSLFLKDRSRNSFTGQVLEVSSLFKWYGEDFRRGWMTVSSLSGFLADHAADLGLTESERERLMSGEIKIKYKSYNWKLNRIPQ
ncbi:MAG: DUF547 domain-containing protein [Desulforhopalus sp.]